MLHSILKPDPTAVKSSSFLTKLGGNTKPRANPNWVPNTAKAQAVEALNKVEISSESFSILLAQILIN